MAPTLLNLPFEVRSQIYSYLFVPPEDLVIRSLFIRSNFRNVFMSQRMKNLEHQVSLVCKQIAEEATPILYGVPMWAAATRLESLASQIGPANFANIRRMEIDVDDLPGAVMSLARDREIQKTFDDVSRDGPRQQRALLTFSNLEELIVAGPQAAGLSNESCPRRVREEALRLCGLAAKVLDLHPLLDVLAVQVGGHSDGGSDARDLSLGRVKWRFVTNESKLRATEIVFELAMHIEELQNHLYNESTTVLDETSLPKWLANGSFRQYPYLERAINSA